MSSTPLSAKLHFHSHSCLLPVQHLLPTLTVISVTYQQLHIIHLLVASATVAFFLPQTPSSSISSSFAASSLIRSHLQSPIAASTPCLITPQQHLPLSNTISYSSSHSIPNSAAAPSAASSASALRHVCTEVGIPSANFSSLQPQYKLRVV